MTRSLYREHVVPLFKGPRPTGCQKPLCRTGNLCSACRGRDNRLKGLRKQNTARKRLAIGARFAGQQGNEENWRGYFRVEVKAGKQCAPIFLRYIVAENQSTASKAHGDTRPFLAVFMPDDAEDGLVLMRLSTFRREIAPLLEP